MSLKFDESYFTTNENGMRKYKNFPHFKDRALWIKDNLSGGILEIGCAYGFLIEELNKLGIMIGGIDISEYAISQANTSIKDQVKVSSASVIINYYDWIISWNVLDCLQSDEHAFQIAQSLNSHAKNQLHILCMSGKDYIKQGYFVRDYSYWRKLLPNAHLICYKCGTNYSDLFSKVPLSGKVSQ